MDQTAPPPPIAALFTVVFDQRKGYTIQWQRTAEGSDLDLEGVEFKALPSGLHSQTEDLVYFTHQHKYAGISAFVHSTASEEQRNASFLSIGALLPLKYGRLGKAWLYAHELRQVGQELVKDISDTRPLELLWKQYGSSGSNSTASPSSPTSNRRESMAATLGRKRGMSESLASLAPETAFSSHHPAHSMLDLLDLFGPLIFPLTRAAVLRQRVLFMGEPPVKRMCHLVYNISMLSSLSRALDEVLPEPSTRQSRPLFNVGISDMGELSALSTEDDGWLASTTDNILGEKHDLYDLLVILPDSNSKAATHQKWPTLRTSNQQTIKATQRDLRRYLILRDDLKRIQIAREHFSSTTNDSDDNDNDSHPLLTQYTPSASQIHGNDSAIIEQVSWTWMAYNGFLWWASAGEQDAWENEESRSDRDLLSDLPLIHEAFPPSPSLEVEAREVATVLMAYFQRVSREMVVVVADVVERADDETEEGIQEDAVVVGLDDVRRMGLDTWSLNDRVFVQRLMRKYFGREASVEDGGLRVCGMRVC